MNRDTDAIHMSADFPIAFVSSASSLGHGDPQCGLEVEVSRWIVAK